MGCYAELVGVVLIRASIQYVQTDRPLYDVLCN